MLTFPQFHKKRFKPKEAKKRTLPFFHPSAKPLKGQWGQNGANGRWSYKVGLLNRPENPGAGGSGEITVDACLLVKAAERYVIMHTVPAKRETGLNIAD